ncbi:MAG: BamA/TamA family outer membrane protein [Gammaproteobacteria bacterium]|jgi:hypothetical protein|nr:BamA/TamA family outer membrane protein [Gammaproteobacteria bacterium]MDH3821643.1 BamA/TamA family outer membrane protein [Gammaproteobacteria bacterium]
MNRLSCLSFVLVLLASNPAVAETKSGDDSEQNFETPGVESSLVSNILHLDEANTALNPFQKLAKSWPEDLVIAPIPAYSPQLGWNLTLGGAYFLDIGEKDADVSPSLVGGFAMAAENGSYAYGAGTYLHLLNDKLRVKAGAAHIDIRYRFYGIGNEIDFLNIDVLQEGPAYFLTGSWNVWKKLYVGLGYRRGSVDTRLRFDVDDSSFFDPVLNIELGAISIPIEIDSRDHEQFPRNGWQILGQTVLYRESVGSDFEAETYKLSINRYFPMRETDVLAARLVVRSASEDVPFFLLSTFGGTTDLRGYPSGRYRDRQMYAVQTEYRWQFSDRWIFTGFAGVGEVAEHFSEMGRNFLPAGGVGARFVLSEKHKIGLSFDVATGKDGTEVYFGVGEAF